MLSDPVVTCIRTPFSPSFSGNAEIGQENQRREFKTAAGSCRCFGQSLHVGHGQAEEVSRNLMYCFSCGEMQ
jgi:hypothetical protein